LELSGAQTNGLFSIISAQGQAQAGRFGSPAGTYVKFTNEKESHLEEIPALVDTLFKDFDDETADTRQDAYVTYLV
jgi:hypothetical protein